KRPDRRSRMGPSIQPLRRARMARTAAALAGRPRTPSQAARGWGTMGPMSVPPRERPLAQHRAARDRRLLRIGIGALAFLAIIGLAIGASLGSGTPEAGPVAG